jgi:hypothetical protein
MIGHPTETKKEIKDTQDMIFHSHIDILGLSIPLPFPGSPLYSIAQTENIISTLKIDQFASKQLGEGYSGIYPLYIPKKLSKKYIFSQMKNINRHFYLKPKILITHFLQDILSPKQLISDFKDFFSLIKIGMSSRKPYKQNPNQK